MTAAVIPFQPGEAVDRLDEVRAVAKAIEHDPDRETEFLERLARSFYDAPVHPGDEIGGLIRDLLAALLKNRGKAMPEVRICPRCDVRLYRTAEHQRQHPHSALCQNTDGTETELSDEAVLAAVKVLKRRAEANQAKQSALDDEIPF